MMLDEQSIMIVHEVAIICTYINNTYEDGNHYVCMYVVIILYTYVYLTS